MPVPESRRPRVLVLGGTAEARDLCEQAATRWGDRCAVILSLAGRTAEPAAAPGLRRSGGFGGVAGMVDYLRREAIAAVIDATHPFATTIARHAREAADAAGVPRVVLLRPDWVAEPGDRWIEVADHAAAAAALPGLGQRAWVTFGDGLVNYATFDGLWFLVRRIDAGEPPPLSRHEIVYGRGPFILAGERALIDRYRIDVLVTKASGGSVVPAKLIAARERQLPVVMICRPPAEPGPTVTDAAAALAWVDATLDGSGT